MKDWLYPVFLLCTLIELMFEIRLSRRNSTELLRQGAKEIAPGILRIMIGLYVLIYIGSVIEYYISHSSVTLSWFAGFLGLYAAAKALKFWAVSSLGRFWTMRVLVVPGSSAVTTGPYRWIRHPNYVAVLGEIAGTTLPGRAVWTCLTVLALFGVALYYRIRSEEKALADCTDYSRSMAAKRRFLP